MKRTIPTPPALPLRRDFTLAYRLSLAVVLLVVAASAAGLLLGTLSGLYGDDPTRALGEVEAGLLLPGLLGQDAFNLAVAVPLLLGSMWLARRGSLVGLLLWPGALLLIVVANELNPAGSKPNDGLEVERERPERPARPRRRWP